MQYIKTCSARTTRMLFKWYSAMAVMSHLQWYLAHWYMLMTTTDHIHWQPHRLTAGVAFGPTRRRIQTAQMPIAYAPCN